MNSLVFDSWYDIPTQKFHAELHYGTQQHHKND
jgi:hypothetical protein